MTQASTLITQIKQQLGQRLTIMGHHYQQQAVIDHTDMQGDSLELARKVADITSEHIVFCGVFFMAESAALLARTGQHVYIPDPSADCSMALMAPASRLRQVLEQLQGLNKKIVPLSYVNSSLEVKAVVGEHGGAVCTSANAKRMLEWAFDQGDTVLFLPDKCLGANTAHQLGLANTMIHQLDIRELGKRIDREKAAAARLLLWPGHCCIHTKFTVAHVEKARADYPNVKVIVHPECDPAVVAAADAAGSTSFIINYVNNAPAGETIVIGTEINLVDRLARKNAGRLKVMPLLTSSCSYMARTTEENLLAVLQGIVTGAPIHEVTPEKKLFAPARQALERMLTVCR